MMHPISCWREKKVCYKNVLCYCGKHTNIKQDENQKEYALSLPFSLFSYLSCCFMTVTAKLETCLRVQPTVLDIKMKLQ